MPRLFAVSQENPDPTGAQMKSLLEYLARRHLIRWVWFDFSCTYQGNRTTEQQRDFDGMLPHINLLYLGASVLILFDRRKDAAPIEERVREERAETPTGRPVRVLRA